MTITTARSRIQTPVDEHPNFASRNQSNFRLESCVMSMLVCGTRTAGLSGAIGSVSTANMGTTKVPENGGQIVKSNSWFGHVAGVYAIRDT